MAFDYYSRKNGTIGDRVDIAWQNYQDNSQKEEEKFAAIHFLIDTFNLREIPKKPEALNQILTKLMEQRAEQMKLNPEFIPEYQTKKNGSYHFFSSDPEQLSFGQSVVEQDKRVGVVYLNDEERAKYKLDIVNGQFRQNGKIYDCFKQGFTSHGKIGWAAFTLNQQGELSVFSHHGGQDKNTIHLRHSSMNAGSPVLAAGEIQIINGKLHGINTHSGHYHPSLYSIYRFLDYLDKQGVDISNTMIYLRNENKSLKTEKITAYNLLSLTRVNFHQTAASNVYKSMKSIIQNNIDTINNYLNNPKTKLKQHLLQNKMTKEKVKLLNEFKSDLEDLKEILGNTTSPFGLKASLSILDKKINELLIQYKSINPNSKGMVIDSLETIRENVDNEIKHSEALDVNFDSFKKHS